MLKISDLLSRFNNSIFQERKRIETIHTVLKEKLTIDVPYSSIKIKNSIIYITAHHIIKTEILLKKEEFLEEFKKTPTLSFITDIQ